MIRTPLILLCLIFVAPIFAEPMAPPTACYVSKAQTLGDDEKSNAFLLGVVSALAYVDDNVVEPILKNQLGFTNVQFIGADEAGVKTLKDGRIQVIAAETRAIWAENEKGSILAFKGSRDPIDFVTDLLALPVPLKSLGNVHEGIYGALIPVWKRVKTQTLETKSIPLYLTGHSLGGGLATLAAAQLLDEEDRALAAKSGWTHPYVKGVVSFGSPRVGDTQFVANFDRLLKESSPTAFSARYANNVDLVPRIASAFTHVSGGIVFGLLDFKRLLDVSQWGEDFDPIGELDHMQDDIWGHVSYNYLEYTYRRSHGDTPSGCLPSEQSYF